MNEPQTVHVGTFWVGNLQVDATALYLDGQALETTVRLFQHPHNDTLCSVSRKQLPDLIDELNEVIDRYRI